MNILLVSEFPIPHGGGLSSHVEDLIKALHNGGHVASLIEGSLTKPGKIAHIIHRIISGGIGDPFRCWYMESKIKKTIAIVEQHLKDNSVDVIHCHDPLAGYAVQEVLSKSKYKIPVIETIHGPKTYESQMTIGGEIDESKFLSRCWEIESRAFEKATHLIAVDTGQANIAINDFHIEKNKVTVMFNSVSCEIINSVLEKSPSIEVPKPYMLVPRRLVEKNGVQTAIKALADLKADSDINLVIAGNGPLRPNLEQLARDLEVESRVIFLGSIDRDEVLRLANEALAVVIPSIPTSGVIEATSIAAIEAMACGTAVIASDIGGLAELIKHDQTGFLVPHSAPQALSEAVLMLLKNHDHRDRICHQAQQYVLQNLDISVWFPKVLRIYEDVLTKSAQAAS